MRDERSKVHDFVEWLYEKGYTVIDGRGCPLHKDQVKAHIFGKFGDERGM